MMQYLFLKSSNYDSPEAAIQCIIGLQSNFGCSERYQQHSKKVTPFTVVIKKNIDEPDTAFFTEDQILINKHKRSSNFTLYPSTMIYFSTCQCYQNNGNNSQMIAYIHHLVTSDLCYISTTIRSIPLSTCLAIKSESPPPWCSHDKEEEGQLSFHSYQYFSYYPLVEYRQNASGSTSKK